MPAQLLELLILIAQKKNWRDNQLVDYLAKFEKNVGTSNVLRELFFIEKIIDFSHFYAFLLILD